MNVDRIEKLVRLFGASRSRALTVEADGWQVSLRRGGTPAPVPPLGSSEAALIATPPYEEPVAIIPAPLVGIFRQGDEPIQAGDSVEAGQTVGNIESMKILNPVVADVGGEILEVLVEDGVPVEYGQNLFRVRPMVEPIGEEGEEWSEEEGAVVGH
jgi:oxaloacetate decarboxylase alpha subunit